MLKKILTALFISSFATSSFAYLVQTNFTVENQTKVPMVITVTGGDGKIISKPIASGAAVIFDKNKLYKDFGGWTFDRAVAPFEIRSDDAAKKLYVQGQIFYGIYGSFWEEYSFLDSVSFAKGLNVDSTYTCWAQWHNAFENKMVISGSPGQGMEWKQLSADVQHCNGFKSSTISDDHQTYTPICSDNTPATFNLVREAQSSFGPEFGYQAQTGNYYMIARLYVTPTNDKIKQDLDNQLKTLHTDEFSRQFCGSW